MTPAPKIINDPPTRWLERVRRDNQVWLVKEKSIAIIEWPYESPEPGHYTGRIGIRHCGIHSWYISSDGRGINGSLLMLPIEGHLAENPEPLPEPVVRHVYREMEHMKQRLDILERRVNVLDPLGITFDFIDHNTRFKR